jgi:CheY-like chemotaxis protein
MQGSISVTSEPGIGTKFTFKIRLKRRATVAPPDTAHLRGHRVLVAEPNDALRASVVRLLEQYGLEAVGCRDLEAVHAATDFEKVIDLIIVDSNFSGATGAVADLASQRNIPIVLLAPLGVPASELPPSLPNEWRRLPKPVHASALLRVLESVLASGERAQAPPAASSHRNEHEIIPDPHHTRILIVEDNMVNQKLIKRMLANLGYDAEVVNGGRECLEACGREQFDLILMDIQMPGMDGFEATEELRRLGDRVWIVALTAHVMIEDRERCFAAGMNDFLAKPIRLDALKAALAKSAASLKR